MESLEEIYQVFYENSFEREKTVNSDTFNGIFSNGYEMYFVKYLEELTTAEEIWEYENEIFDYQNKIVLNSTDLAYNLNFVIISNKINLKTRRILEQDKYTSKKIIIHIENLSEDIELLPFNVKKFEKSKINTDLDTLLSVKLKKVGNAEVIINILNNNEIVEEDINNLLAFMSGGETCERKGI